MLYFANADLSRVKNNEVMYKDSDGSIKGTGIFIQDNMIVATKDLEIPPNTLHLGDNIELHENGGFIENTTKTLSKRYILLDYETGNSGSLQPVFYKRAALETNAIIQSDNETIMDNVTQINITPSTDSEVSKIYFDLAESVNNFKIKLEVNGNDVAYYPSKNAWNDDTVEGYNLVEGINSITLDPHFSFLTSYAVKFHFKGDSGVNIKGNGITPYIAVDRQKISKLEVITEDKQLVSNSLYANDNKTDLQQLIDSSTGRKAIYMSYGSFGGDDVVINDKDQISIIGPEAAGTTCCELLERGLSITECERIRISNLQIEGQVNINSGLGKHLFKNCQFMSGLNIGNESNFITFNSCDFGGNITIDASFTGTIYFVQCDMGGVTITNNANMAQVIFTQCTNLPLTLSNIYLGGLNSFTNLASRLDVSQIFINGVNINNIFQAKS